MNSMMSSNSNYEERSKSFKLFVPVKTIDSMENQLESENSPSFKLEGTSRSGSTSILVNRRRA